MGIIILLLLFMLGACFGSFLCCSARRLHLKSKKKKLGRRSVCLNCKTKLKWYDNIPIVSWLLLKGKCRKCGKSIGAAEILSELGLGLTFFLFGLGFMTSNAALNDFLSRTPMIYLILAIFFFFILCLGFLAIYDGLYGELPSFVLYLSIFFAAIIAAYYFSAETWTNLFFSVLILGGLYLILFLVSKGKWVGNGDWLLGVAIGLVLNSPWLALLTLFLSNLLACFVMLPVVKGKNKKISFGPFLVAAFVIVYAFSDFLLNVI